MKNCKECNKEFGGINHFGSSKYCSDNCRGEVRKRVNLICKERAKKKINDGDVDFIAKTIFKKYKQKAPYRNLEFNLSLEFFKKNVNAPCYYCGELIVKVGFDRLNNSLGYTELNSVPCCQVCNFMKGTLTENEFNLKCATIYKHKLKLC